MHVSTGAKNIFLSLILAVCSVQAATVTFKDVIPTGATRTDIPSFSNFLSMSEAGIKTGSGDSAETTYIEEIRQSQILQFPEPTATGLQGVPLNSTNTFHGTLVQSSNGFWFSQDIPLTITSDGAIATTTQAYVQTCSVAEDGKYGCVEYIPLGQQVRTTTYTNTASDVVFTDVGELKTHNAAIGSMALMTWHWMVVVCGGIIAGRLVSV